MITRNISTHSDFLTGKSNPISELRTPQKRKENTHKQSIEITERDAHEAPTLTPEPTKTKKKASLAEITNNSVFAGLNQFNDSLLSTIDYLLPTEFLGKYDFISNWADYYSREAYKYNEKRLDSISDRGKFVQESSNLLTGLSSAAPGAILAAMTGGGSAAAQGGTAALTATSGAAAGGTGAALATAAQQTMKNPMFWSSVGQTLGKNYEKAKADGANELQANGYAFASSFLNGALESSGGIDTLPGVLKSGTGPASAWARSALTEGLEEPVQSTVSGLSEKLFYDRDKPLVSLTDSSAVIHPGRMGQEFVMGTAVGGILGAEQLAGSRLYMDTPDVLAQRGDYSGYVRELQEITDRQKVDELLAEYEKHVANTETDNKVFDIANNVLLESGQKFDKLVGAKGAYNDVNDPNGKYREQHAEKYYLSLRNSNRQSIVDVISKNSGVTEDTVSKMFDHLIVNEYELDGRYVHFDPDYYIAGSLQRLREGKNIQPHDLILIQHEAMEYDLMNDGDLNYEDAHAIANESFNYHQALMDWLMKEGK